MDSTVFQFIGQQVANATEAFVTPASTQLMGILQSVVLIGVSLYILITGIQVVIGVIQTPIPTPFPARAGMNCWLAGSPVLPARYRSPLGGHA